MCFEPILTNARYLIHCLLKSNKLAFIWLIDDWWLSQKYLIWECFSSVCHFHLKSYVSLEKKFCLQWQRNIFLHEICERKEKIYEYKILHCSPLTIKWHLNGAYFVFIYKVVCSTFFSHFSLTTVFIYNPRFFLN